MPGGQMADMFGKDEMTVNTGETALIKNIDDKIMKKMADMLCQQNLITPDEKSRLILLIDKERES